MTPPKFTPETVAQQVRLDDVKPRRDLTLDDIQNEDWLIRILAKAQASKVLEVDQALMDELTTIMADCTETKGEAKLALPVVREVDDLEALAICESQTVARLARVAEISLSLYRIRKKLEAFWDMCEERINRYPVVNKELTNDRKRTLYYRAVLKPLRDRQAQLDLAFEMASKIEEHLNNVHFSVKEISAMGRDYLTRTTRVDRDQMR